MEYNYFRVFYSPDKDGDSFSHSSNIKFKKDISRLKRGLKESSRTIEERVRIIEGLDDIFIEAPVAQPG
ncbi:hypothetical protein J4205_04335 [Candidatus Pacearchaeota archaeon]|nr:hypothetical protein [Candidatus Pacearchaeota archaeon]